MGALVLLFAFDETHYQQDNDGSQVLLHTVKLKCILALILEQSFSKNLEACAKTENRMMGLFHNGLGSLIILLD